MSISAAMTARIVYCSATGLSAWTNCGTKAEVNSSVLGLESATNSARKNAARPLAEAAPEVATSACVGARHIPHAR